MDKVSAIRTGKAGEYRVMSELIMRGYSPALIAVDDGIDIILSDGRGIGVKATAKAHIDKKSYSYRYKITLNPHQLRYKDGKPARVKNIRKYKVDYFIVWLMDKDEFYIFPISAVKDTSMINLTASMPDEERIYKREPKKSKSKYEQYKNAWHLLEK